MPTRSVRSISSISITWAKSCRSRACPRSASKNAQIGQDRSAYDFAHPTIGVSMDISLSGRSAIITGADVALVARGREALDEAVSGIRAKSQAKVIGIAADVASAADVKRAYDEAMRAFGKLDIVVNNAGTSRTSAFEALDRKS